MTKISYYIGLALSMILAGCSADDEDFASSLLPQQGEPIQVTVGMPSQDDSRASFPDNDAVNKQLVWDTDDQLLLVGFDESDTYKGQSKLTVTAGSEGKQTGEFTGFTVAGATKYNVYYLTTKLNGVPTEDATTVSDISMNYDGQAQTAPNDASHLKDYLFLKADQVPSTDLETKGITLTMQNAIFIFDIKSLNSNLGNNPSKLDWQCGNKTIQSIALTGDNYTNSKVYMCFDPTNADAKLDENEKMRILFTNRTTNDQYAVWATRSSGSGTIDYAANNRYEVTIGTGSENLKDWYKYTGSTEILIMTSDGKAPSPEDFGENLNLQETPRDDGYFVVKSKNDEPITVIPKDFLFCEYNVTKVLIPETVTEIGESAFVNCFRMELITLPEGLTSIGNKVFNGCSALVLESLPSGVTSIGENAFYRCSKLALESLPSGVTSIGKNAFLEACLGAAAGTVFTIPASVTSIGNSAFQRVSNVTNLIFDSPITARTWAEGAIGTDVFEGTSLTEITLPNDFKVIPQRMFQNNQSLKKVDFNGAKIESIGENAFYGCSALVLESLPSGVTSIGNKVFNGCSALVLESLPSGVTSIGVGTFEGCSKLALKSLPSGVTSIGENAFYGCSALALESLPSGVTSIGENAFWEARLGAAAGTVFTIPASVTSIGNNAFYGVSNLQKVIWQSPDASRKELKLGHDIFGLCKSLKNIILPNDLKDIPNSFLGNCQSLESLTIPASVKSIGDDFIFNCPSLKELRIEAGKEMTFSEYSFRTSTDDNNNPNVDLYLSQSWSSVVDGPGKPSHSGGVFSWAGCTWKSIEVKVTDGNFTPLPDTENGLN